MFYLIRALVMKYPLHWNLPQGLTAAICGVVWPSALSEIYTK
jgi:hypothetical protein